MSKTKAQLEEEVKVLQEFKRKTIQLFEEISADCCEDADDYLLKFANGLGLKLPTTSINVIVELQIPRGASVSDLHFSCSYEDKDVMIDDFY